MMYVEAAQFVGKPDKLSRRWLTAANSTCYAAEMETSTATISVLQVTPIHAGRVLALANVELILDGVSIILHGVQVRADALNFPKSVGCTGALP